MSYDPWVGKLDDGTQVLVTVQTQDVFEPDGDGLMRLRAAPKVAVELAFRPVGARTWGPPCRLVKAP